MVCFRGLVRRLRVLIRNCSWVAPIRCGMLVGLLAAAGTLSGTAGASPATAPKPRVISGASPFAASDCGPAVAPDGHDGYEMMPFLATNPADPENFTVSWMQDFLRANLVAASVDGGANFTTSAPKVSRCSDKNSEYESATHPEVSFGADPDSSGSRAYLISSIFQDAAPAVSAVVCGALLPCGALPNSAIVVNTSQDGGRLWSEPSPVVEGKFPVVIVQDPHIAADPKRPETAYATWTELDLLGSTPVRVARTVDGGQTWGRAQTLPVVNTPGRATMPFHIRVLADETVLVLYLENDPFGGPLPTSLWATRSGDQGMTWSLPAKMADIPDGMVTDPERQPADENFVIFANFQSPSVAAAPDEETPPDGETLYVVWHIIESSTSSSIAFAKSTDGGQTWSQGEVLPASATQTFLPTVAVNADGIVGVAYHDFRNDVAGDGALTTDVWFRHSHDKASSWRESHLAGPFDAHGSPPDLVRLWYPPLAGAPRGFRAAVAQPNPSDSSTGPNDIRYTRLRVPDHPELCDGCDE